jgi:UDPglucose 6-dehydrogenase
LAESLNVEVVGAGYVGLATGACLAHVGHRVTCVDEDRVAGLREGRMPFYEPGLGEIVARGLRSGRLLFAGSDGLPDLARSADAVFIAVGTPQGPDGSARA